MKIIKSKVKAVVSGRWSVVSFAPSHPRSLAAVVSALFFLTLCLCVSVVNLQAQSNEFTYQGRLLDNTLPPTANYDFEFSLWDSLVAGTQQGTTQTVTGVAVANGIFTVRLNFGAQFPGAARFLEIHVRPTGGGAYTTLAPRQPFTSAPYSIRSLNSAEADALSANCVGCVTAAQIGSVNGSAVTGTIPVASVPAGSGSYIQNQNAGAQVTSNFNISGTGTANIFSAGTQYNIGANRLLSNAGTNNLFAGVGAALINTGSNNSFFGRNAGQNNNTGAQNSFFGREAGRSNDSGIGNSFFGQLAGPINTTGGSNSFFGSFTGNANISGGFNSFFGTSTGFNSTGDRNSFFGSGAGGGNISGSNNTIIGFQANVGADNLTNATAIGAGAVVGASNTIALGRTSGADTVQVPGNLNVAGTFTGSVSASSITGVVAAANGGTGTDTSGAARGSILYKDAVGNWVSLSPGTAGQVLITNGAGADPSWGTNFAAAGLINAVKEQQSQIEAQQNEITRQTLVNQKLQDQLKRQQSELDALKTLVCAQNPTAEICKEEK